MKRALIDLLTAPTLGAPLQLRQATAEQQGEIQEGELIEPVSGRTYAIRQAIPRFVNGNGYTASFGFQWHRYATTQLDKRNGTSISRTRFFQTSGWDADALRGARVLEVGCGAGRFTEVVLGTGAEVYAVDDSPAVDVCWANHGPHPRLHVCQADLYQLPLRPASFDRVFCYGVLQHTPDVPAAFQALVRYLKPGGWLSIDIYHKAWFMPYLDPKYWYRPVTRHVAKAQLLAFIQWYVPRWLPVSTRLNRMPKVGAFMNRLIPCCNYAGTLPLNAGQLTEWAVLDTLDMLSAHYDQPQTVATVSRWFEEAGLTAMTVARSGPVVVGNARKP